MQSMIEHPRLEQLQKTATQNVVALYRQVERTIEMLMLGAIKYSVLVDYGNIKCENRAYRTYDESCNILIAKHQSDERLIML